MAVSDKSLCKMTDSSKFYLLAATIFSRQQLQFRSQDEEFYLPLTSLLEIRLFPADKKLSRCSCLKHYMAIVNMQ